VIFINVYCARAFNLMRMSMEKRPGGKENVLQMQWNAMQLLQLEMQKDTGHPAGNAICKYVFCIPYSELRIAKCVTIQLSGEAAGMSGEGGNVTIAGDAPAVGTGLSHNRSQWIWATGVRILFFFFWPNCIFNIICWS